MRMNNTERRKSDWYFPPYVAALLGLFIVLPMAVIGGWLGTGIYNAGSVGDISAFWAAVALGGIGTLLLFFARLPLYRQRRFLVFGPRELDQRHRRLYWWAYGFIIASVVLLVLLILIVR
jgi:hypothetical protein